MEKTEKKKIPCMWRRAGAVRIHGKNRKEENSMYVAKSRSGPHTWKKQKKGKSYVWSEAEEPGWCMEKTEKRKILCMERSGRAGMVHGKNRKEENTMY